MNAQPVAPGDIRRRLEARRSELMIRSGRVRSDLGRQNEPLAADWDERAIQLENDAALEAIEGATEDELEAINTALERLSLGLYGVCERCGDTIPAGRLSAVPHATTCAKCPNR
jgi:RNA polymerase-binding transcription factor